MIRRLFAAAAGLAAIGLIAINSVGHTAVRLPELVDDGVVDVVMAAALVTPESIQKIQCGMALEEVVAILGPPGTMVEVESPKPDGTVIRSVRAHWGSNIVRMPIHHGKAGQPEGCSLVIHLQDGKVVSMVQAGIGSQDHPKHLADARALVKALDLKNTSYTNGMGRVEFKGLAESHTDCSGLLNHLLKHSYGYDDNQLKAWFGTNRPKATHYHKMIVKTVGFTRITRITDVRPGDILAVKYLIRKDHTGHVMLVSGAPKKMKAQQPIQEGTDQWEVKVIDSSHSGHGPNDTRHAKGKEGKDHDGLGEGVLRIYTDKAGKVAGFAWSTVADSKFVAPQEEELVIGRIVPAFKPLALRHQDRGGDETGEGLGFFGSNIRGRNLTLVGGFNIEQLFSCRLFLWNQEPPHDQPSIPRPELDQAPDPPPAKPATALDS
jgi:outer membrane protein assembly factor BamE (lipoprotein component of BamABCDE complex)